MTSDDATGWMLLPDAEHAAAHATPFPDFAPDAEVGLAVYGLTVAQVERIVEAERGR